MSYSKEELQKMYNNLVYARIFVNKMHESAYGGLIRSSFHSPLGQEAIGVGIVAAMRDTDWLASTHRMQVASILRFDTYQFIAEIFGKYDGMQKGVSFDYHCSDLSDGVRMLAPSGIMGAMAPQYTGFAWSIKQQKKNDVVVVGIGDGACNEGAVYEAWNIAALYKVPIVFVIENNEWAMTVPLERGSVNPDICKRAEPLGLPVRIIDGNDVMAVRKAMETGLEMARKCQPNIIEMKTLRWDAHFVGQGNDYRTDADKIEDFKKNNDPVTRFEEYLLNMKVIDQDYINQTKTELEKQLAEMVEKAKNAPKPEKDDIYRKEFIYANPETGGDL